jgi:hypothetical protein
VCVTGRTEGGAKEKFSRPAQSVVPNCWGVSFVCSWCSVSSPNMSFYVSVSRTQIFFVLSLWF